jgi:Rieske Fe-S protein
LSRGSPIRYRASPSELAPDDVDEEPGGANAIMTDHRDCDAPANACRNLRFPARRGLLHAALVAGVGLSLPRAVLAKGDEPNRAAPPEPGDVFVFTLGDRAGETIAPRDLPLGGPQIAAWPKDPKANLVRNGSPFNQVLLLRLDPHQLDEATAVRSADGVLAYSSLCAHAGCPVTGWVKDHGTTVLKCFCHLSEYDPRRSAAVVSGPAPHPLAALPVAVVGGTLVVAGKFIGDLMPQIGRGFLPAGE